MVIYILCSILVCIGVIAVEAIDPTLLDSHIMDEPNLEQI